MAPPLYTRILDAARTRGFPHVGAVDLSLARDFLAAHFRRYEEWVQAGMGAGMGYLTRDQALAARNDPALLLPEARSVLCFLIPYNRNPRGSIDPLGGPRYARYLEGPDYHDQLKDRLEAVMNSVAEPGLRWKTCVDTSAVLERSWADAAGLGWIGKNTMLIHPKEGSYFFLAEILLNRALEKVPEPLRNRCGSCTSCIEACPTQALGAGGLDSRRCISFLTLEKRGEFSLQERQLMKRAGNWVAGCDLCQEACPFNRKPTRGHEAEISKKTWSQALFESPEERSIELKTSALSRIKAPDYERNLKLAFENSGLQFPNRTP